jgi:catechol 2,3-dioxygenase-like lactoylglutathione lyase family enzyme
MAIKLNHLHIKTKTPEKTAKFYVDVFGAKITSQSASGYRVDLDGLSLNITDLHPTQKREQKFGMEHLAIDTDELDAVVARLKEKGIGILEETVVTGNRRVCFFEGPDGVQLEFLEMQK